MSFRLIYADPPWWFAKRKGGRVKDVRDHYEVAKVGTMKTWAPHFDALSGDGPCALLMWATKSHLANAIELMEAWGFRFATVFLTWVKRTKSGRLFKGPGAYLGSNAEFLLLGQRKGRQAVVPARALVAPDVLMTGRLPHSAKPPEVRDLIAKAFGELPRVEVFARQRVPGWHAIGLEVGGEAHRLGAGTHIKPLPPMEVSP